MSIIPDNIGHGHWHIKVTRNSRYARPIEWPDHAAVEAALRDFEDDLVDLIGKAQQLQPKSKPLSPAERKAWNDLIKVGGPGFGTLTSPSIQSVADEVVRRLRERIKPTLKPVTRLSLSGKPMTVPPPQ